MPTIRLEGETVKSRTLLASGFIARSINSYTIFRIYPLDNLHNTEG